MPNKTRPAPLGATYKQDVRLRRVRPKPDAAPNGAKRVLFNRGYKDFAPTALDRSVTIVDRSETIRSIPLSKTNPNQTFVTSVSLW